MSAVAPLQQALASPLGGRRIVVTRPLEQAQHLRQLLTDAGAEVLLFPLLSIGAVADSAPLCAAAAELDAVDLAIFISPNAVERALAPILAQRSWPRNVAVAALGKGSERALARLGIDTVIAPRLRFDSEALLELPELQHMAGRRVLIFRGDGGRELLGDTLRARGAQVDYVSCYRRDKPTAVPAPLLVHLLRGELDAILISSSEGLRNLHQLLDAAARAALARTPLFVPHPRIAEQATQLGLAQVSVTAPGDEGLVAGLIRCFASNAHGH